MLRNLIKDHLKSNGYDGLWNNKEKCDCGLDNLAPCHRLDLDQCQFAHKSKIKNTPKLFCREE